MQRFALSLALAIAVCAWLQLGFPETARAQKRAQAQVQTAARISDRDLRAFAKVYVEYKALQQEYGAKIEQTKDTKEKEALQKEASTQLQSVLQKHKLTADEYNHIFKAVNEDEKLRDKVLPMVEAERKKS